MRNDRDRGSAQSSVIGFLVIAVLAVLAIGVFVWFLGSSNVATPGGYVGYVTQGAVFGKKQFISTQKGPTSTGKMWMAEVTNVSVTPYTFDETFDRAAGTAVLSSDNMQISYSIHITFLINPEMVKEFVEHYTTIYNNDSPDKIVETAYKNIISQRLRTYGRDAVKKYAWQDLTNQIDAIGNEINEKVITQTKDTPFIVQSVVVGNLQFPPSVADAVAENQAQAQITQKKMKEVEQAKLEAQKKVEEAKGIEESNKLISGSLTDKYLQYQAIMAQTQLMSNSQHSTTVYIPTGSMGVPITATTDASNPSSSPTPTQK